MTPSDAGRKPRSGVASQLRVNCPLCGVNISLSHLRNLHVCSKRGSPPKSEEECKNAAVKAVLARMAKRAETHGQSSFREDSPVYTENNG